MAICRKLRPEKATPKFMRSMSSSRKYLDFIEQNSNIEQEALPEKEKEDAVKPLSYQDSREEANFLWRLREYLLLLGALAASVTYTAASLNPRGGIWSANDGGVHVAGDPVVRVTNFRWYELRMINYFKATAFTASLVIVSLLLHSVRRRRHHRLHTLQAATLIDNIIQETQGRKWFNLDLTDLQDHRDSALSDPEEIDADQHLQKSRRLFLLLATLAASITYQAGLSPPGGFWQTDATDGQYQHRDGHPIILNIAYPRGYLSFFYCSAAAFAASLVIIIILLSNKFRTKQIKYWSLQTAKMILDLIGLIGASYAAGSCRTRKSAPAPATDEDDRNRAMQRSPVEATWHVACAAAHHMTGNRSLLVTGGYSAAAHDGEEYMFVHPATGEVRPLRVHGSGSVRTESITLDDVWYVPGLDTNLVSTGQLARQGCAITLGPGGCRITRGDALLGSARFTEDNQFVLDSLKVVSSM